MKLPIPIITCVLCFGLALASTEWPNEPAGAQAMLDCPFNDVNCGGQLWTPTPGILRQPGGAPFSAPNALTSHLPAGATQGGQHTTWPTSATARAMGEIYVGFWWKMNANFQGLKNSTNKLFFIRNWEFSFGKDGVNGVFLLLGQPDQFPWSLGWFHNTGGLDNTHACATNCFPNVGSVPIYRDTWYRVEAYIKSSSCSTCRDGIVRWWVNGTLLGNYTNMNYGSGNMNEFTIGHTWDGSAMTKCYDAVNNPYGRDCSREWLHHFDHLRISAPNGAPAPFYVSSGTLPSAQSGKPYTATLQAAGGKSPYNWAITSGNLLPGLSLNKSTGVISGTPTTGGRCEFTVKALDASVPPAEATKTLSIVASGTSIQERFSAGGSQLSIRTGNRNVLFQMPGAEAYRIGVYDLSGREVWNYSGTGEAAWDHGGKLKKGIYLVRAKQGKAEIKSIYCNVE